jgi:hypothetical protein
MNNDSENKIAEEDAVINLSKESITESFVKKYEKYENNDSIKIHGRKSSHIEPNFSLPRRTKNIKLFEEFLVIGIETNGLEFINDLDELMLSPRIIYNFPNKLNEHELELYNIFNI